MLQRPTLRVPHCSCRISLLFLKRGIYDCRFLAGMGHGQCVEILSHEGKGNGSVEGVEGEGAYPNSQGTPKGKSRGKVHFVMPAVPANSCIGI